MLIAIMGDTFGKVMEQSNLYNLIARTSIYADFIGDVKLSKTFSKNRYLYLVTPDEANEASEWEGNLSAIKTLLKGQESRILDSVKHAVQK